MHTNLIARDWRRLAAFYQELFGCEPVPPERDYSGAALEAGTGVRGATVKGVHLRLPGYDATGPTLEIYTYSREADRPSREVNQPGFAHIAFEVDSVIRPANVASIRVAEASAPRATAKWNSSGPRR